MENRIQELESELNTHLQEYGARYMVFSSTQRGEKIIRGKHISVYIPAKVKVNIDEVVALFEKYYGSVVSVEKPRAISVCGVGGAKEREIILNLE